MTLDELKTLREGEVVVFTKVDKRITEYHNHQVGDELLFYQFNDDLTPFGEPSQVDFMRISGEYMAVSHFSYEICHYIERKVILERNNKLNELGL